MKRNLDGPSRFLLAENHFQVKNLLPAILADNAGEIVAFKSGF
ncbi:MULTISPECIES: hypothetical protein [Yersinia]|uniref:Uncharacterized protein n=1 Tax=Yersinia bercovieri ATCC 43970 TaxID=349968 RepID=A0ABM9Y1B0_YERBE|nr:MULTISPECIES: hypothetical protein [Yersinia]EEQ07494.1 hypothetical protein yberc0001_14090 [Yersinia bercovieri ATCC 43970]MDN0103879.1 hypothetical protein [Yersinia bercovieri]